MPAMMVWPDSWSVLHAERRVFLGQTLQGHAHLFLVGLGLAARPRPRSTGSGNSIFSRVIGCSRSHSVSPVMTSLRPTAAAMSPARTSLISVRVVGVHLQQAADALVLPLVGTSITVACAHACPSRRGRTSALPTNGSLRILKASAEKGCVIAGLA
jgi:hypothetical protein